MKARVSWPLTKTCLLEFSPSVFSSVCWDSFVNRSLWCAQNQLELNQLLEFYYFYLSQRVVNRRSLFIPVFSAKRNTCFQNKGHPLQPSHPAAFQLPGRFGHGWRFWPGHGISTARCVIAKIKLIQLLRFGHYRPSHVSQRVDGTGWRSRLPGWPFGANLVFRPLRIGHREIARFPVEG